MIAGAMLDDREYAVFFLEVLASTFVWGFGFALWEKSVLVPRRQLPNFIPIFVPGFAAAVVPFVILAYEGFKGGELEFQTFLIACGMCGVSFGISAVSAWIAFRLCRRVLRARFTN